MYYLYVETTRGQVDFNVINRLSDKNKVLKTYGTQLKAHILIGAALYDEYGLARFDSHEAQYEERNRRFDPLS